MAVSWDSEEDSWGSDFAVDLGRWKPDLHPRDSKGRFRDKWGLSPAAASYVDGLLARFKPPTLASDDAAATHLRSKKGPRSLEQKEALKRFLTREGNENIQGTLRAGDEPTRDIRTLDGMMQPLGEDLIVSRVFGPDALGLTPEQIAGVEEWTGKRVLDAGYSPTNVGSAYPITGPHIEMRLLVPRGTKAIVVGDDGGPADARTIILDREQPIRFGKITSDGRGGWYILATVDPARSPGGKEPARALGRALPARDKSPAIEATPDELERRGIAPDEGFGPQEQPDRLGEVTPAAGAGQRVLPQQPGQPVASIPNPAGPGSAGNGTAAQSIIDSGGEIPAGAGRVMAEGEQPAPRGKINKDRRPGIVADPEAAAADQDRQTKAREKAQADREERARKAEEVLAKREARLQKLEDQAAAKDAAATEQLAKANDSLAKTVDTQQKLIEQLMDSQGGTRAAGLTEPQREAVLNRVRDKIQAQPGDENDRVRDLARQITQERRAAKAAPAKKAGRAAAPEEAPGSGAEAAPEEPRATPEQIADFRAQEEPNLNARQKGQVRRLGTQGGELYWADRQNGSSHEEALAAAGPRRAGIVARKRTPDELFTELDSGEFDLDKMRAELQQLQKPALQDLLKRSGISEPRRGNRATKADLIDDIIGANTSMETRRRALEGSDADAVDLPSQRLLRRGRVESRDNENGENARVIQFPRPAKKATAGAEEAAPEGSSAPAAKKAAKAAKRTNYTGKQVRGSQIKELAPGDVVSVPSRGGEEQKTVRVVDGDTIVFTDGTSTTGEAGSVKVVSQTGVRKSASARAKEKRESDRKAAGLGLTDAIKAYDSGDITPEQFDENLKSKLTQLRGLEVALKRLPETNREKAKEIRPGMMDELRQTIAGLEKLQREARGGGRQTDAMRTAKSTVRREARETLTPDEQQDLEALTKPVKKATRGIKKAAPAAPVVDAGRPDAGNLTEVRTAKTVAAINAIADERGVRIPTTVGRREDRRAFLEKALSMQDGESKADYDARMAELKSPSTPVKRGRGRPRKADQQAVPEAPAKATKGLRRAGSNDEAPERLDAEEARDRLESQLTERQRGQVDRLPTLQDKESYWTRRANGETHSQAWRKTTPVAAETPAAAKKTTRAKKASPEAPRMRPMAERTPEKKAAPGTAAGRLTASRLTPGTRIMLEEGNDGTWKPTTRRTGVKGFEVTGVGRIQPTNRDRTRVRITARDDDGNEVTLNASPSQTYLLESAIKKATPEKKATSGRSAVKKAAPAEKVVLPTKRTHEQNMTNLRAATTPEEAEAALDKLTELQLGRIRTEIDASPPPQGSSWTRAHSRRAIVGKLFPEVKQAASGKPVKVTRAADKAAPAKKVASVGASPSNRGDGIKFDDFGDDTRKKLVRDRAQEIFDEGKLTKPAAWRQAIGEYESSSRSSELKFLTSDPAVSYEIRRRPGQTGYIVARVEETPTGKNSKWVGGSHSTYGAARKAVEKTVADETPAPAAAEPAKKAARGIKKAAALRGARPVTVKRAADLPGNARDKRRFEGIDDKDTVKARADELVGSGSTSAAAWRTALDEHDFRQKEAGAPAAPTKKVAAKRATKATKTAEAPVEVPAAAEPATKAARKKAPAKSKAFRPPPEKATEPAAAEEAAPAKTTPRTVTFPKPERGTPMGGPFGTEKRRYEALPDDATRARVRAAARDVYGPESAGPSIAWVRALDAYDDGKLPDVPRMRPMRSTTLTRDITPERTTRRTAIKRGGKAITAAEARREGAIEALRGKEISGKEAASYNEALRNVQSGDWTPGRAATSLRGEGKRLRREAQAARDNKDLTPGQRKRQADALDGAAGKYEAALFDLERSQKTENVEKRRFAEGTPAPAKKARAAKAPRRPRAAEEVSADDRAARETMQPFLDEAGVDFDELSDVDKTGVMLMGLGLNDGRISRPEAARRLIGGSRNSKLRKVGEAVGRSRGRKTAKKATEAATKTAPQAVVPQLRRRPPRGEDTQKLVDALTRAQVDQINDLSAESATKYWGLRGRGAGHDTAWRGVPKGDMDALRPAATPDVTPESRRGDVSAIEELRRPTISRERDRGPARLTEEAKNAVLARDEAERAANPRYYPATQEERDLAREAAEIRYAREQTNIEAAKRAPKKAIKKVAPAVTKTRQRRAEQYDAAVGDIPGDDGGLLRASKKDLAEGQPAAAVKKALAARAESYRTRAELVREKEDISVVGDEAAEYDRKADIYQRAADLAGKRVPRVKKAVKPGEKVAVVDLEDGDVAILNGRKGVFRQPKPRTTFIEFPDGSQEKVVKSRLASMVRAKELELKGGPHRANAPEDGTPEAPAKKVTVTRATPAKKVGIRKVAAKKAAPEEVAPEAPAKKAVKKAPAKKAAKFLPPLANGTQRKSATNLEPGDRVRAPQQGRVRKTDPIKEVASVDRDPERRILRVNFTDGTQGGADSPQTAYWMAPDEAPRMRPMAAAGRDTPRSIDADLQAGRITRAEARERIRRMNREGFRADRREVRDAEPQPEAAKLTREQRREDRRVASEQRATIRAEGRQRREERGADLMTEARDRKINTRDSAIKEALQAQDGPNAYRAIRRLDGRISNDREQANLLDYGTRRAPDDQPADYTGGLSPRSRRLRQRAAERARAVDLVWERGHRHEEEQRRPELTPRMQETRARAAARAEAAKSAPRPPAKRIRRDNETPRMTEVLDRSFERREAAKKAAEPRMRPMGDVVDLSARRRAKKTTPAAETPARKTAAKVVPIKKAAPAKAKLDRGGEDLDKLARDSDTAVQKATARLAAREAREAARREARDAREAVSTQRASERREKFGPDGPSHIDLAKLGDTKGLGLSDEQADLDDGKTPASVAKKLDTRAQNEKNHAAIVYGGWDNEANKRRRAEDPDYYGPLLDEDRRNYETGIARGDRLKELADKLRATRRPAVRKAAPAKATKAAAPEAPAAKKARPTITREAAKKAVPAAATTPTSREELEKLSSKELRDLLPEGTKLDRRTAKTDLVEALVGNEPDAQHHVTETPRIRRLREAVEAGTVDEKVLGGGEDGGNVNRVARTRSRRDGEPVVRKRMKQDWHLDPERQADAERITSRYAEEIDADAPASYQPTKDTVFQEHIDGKLASRLSAEDLRAKLDTPEGRRIHLMDLITGNPDRHSGNLMVDKDGKIHAIDHGMNFADGFDDKGPDGDIRPVPPSAHDPFRTLLKATKGTYTRGGKARDDYQWADEVPFTRKEIMDARRALVRMRPEFTRSGRQEWYKNALARADALLKRAKPDARPAKATKAAPIKKATPAAPTKKTARPTITRQAAKKAVPEAEGVKWTPSPGSGIAEGVTFHRNPDLGYIAEFPAEEGRARSFRAYKKNNGGKANFRSLQRAKDWMEGRDTTTRGEFEPGQPGYRPRVTAAVARKRVAGSAKSRTQAPADYRRFKVPEDKASWNTEFPEYRPRPFTADVVKDNDETKKPKGLNDPKRYWADPMDVKDVKRKFRSYEGEVALDELGRPVNPYTRTGVQDRGELGKWGANFAGDPIVTRIDPKTGRLQMLTINRKDGQPAIPGGMVDFNEDIFETLRRELKEETGVDLTFDQAKKIYQGYVDDPRNTDNAWMETSAFHRHLDAADGDRLEKFDPEDADEIKGVHWVDIDKDMLDGLYASHGSFVREAMRRLLTDSDSELTPAQKTDLRRALRGGAPKKAAPKVLTKAETKALPDQPGEAATPSPRAAKAAARRAADTETKRRQARQAHIDRLRETTKLTSRLDDALHGASSERAINHHLDTAGLPEQRDRLRKAFRDGGREGLQKELEKVEKENGLTRTVKPGDMVAYDPKVHRLERPDAKDQARIEPGEQVMAVSSGYTADIPGDKDRLTLEPASVARVIKPTKADTEASRVTPSTKRVSDDRVGSIWARNVVKDANRDLSRGSSESEVAEILRGKAEELRQEGLPDDAMPDRLQYSREDLDEIAGIDARNLDRLADELDKPAAPAAPAKKARPTITREGRGKAASDLISVYNEDGEDGLRARLDSMDVDQLKGVIADGGMDSSGLARRWRSRDRLTNLIVDRTKDRATKGRAFRPPKAAAKAAAPAAPEAPVPAAKKVTVRKAIPKVDTVRKNLLDAKGSEGRREVLDNLHDELSVAQWRTLAKRLGAGTQYGSKQDSRDAIERHLASGQGSVPKKNLRDQLRDADVDLIPSTRRHTEDRGRIETGAATAGDDPAKLRTEAAGFDRTARTNRSLADMVEANLDTRTPAERKNQEERVRLLREGADNYDKAAKVFRSRADSIDKGIAAAQSRREPEADRPMPDAVPKPEVPAEPDPDGAYSRYLRQHAEAQETTREAVKRATPAPAVDEKVALTGSPRGDNMYMHGDSATMGVAQAYAAAGRNGSANRMMDLRRRATSRDKSERISPQQVVDELAAIRAAETDPAMQERLDAALGRIDAPKRPLPEIPDNTPPEARRFIERLNDIPHARKGDGEEGVGGPIQGDSLVEQVAQVYRDAAAGVRGPAGEGGRSPSDRIRNILRNKTHESTEASFTLWDMGSETESIDTPRGRTASPLSKELRAWERGEIPSTSTKKADTVDDIVRQSQDLSPEADEVRRTSALDRAAGREKEARIREARGAMDLAADLFNALSAYESNPSGLRSLSKQLLEGDTPGDLDNPRDARARGYDKLKKAMGPESEWDTPDKLRNKLAEVLGGWTNDSNIKIDRRAGEDTAFDPETMTTFNGADIKPGDAVTVVRPGFSYRDTDGTVHQLVRPTVTRRRGPGGRGGGPPLGRGPSGPPPAAGREAQDSTPIAWSYQARGLSKGLDLVPEKDREATTKALTNWVFDKPKNDGTSAEINARDSQEEIVRMAEPRVNAVLRGRIPATAATRRDQKMIDQALDLSRTDKDTTLHRGYTGGSHILPVDYKDRDLTDFEWTEKGYTATTVSEDGAEIYSGGPDTDGFTITFKYPKGSRAIAIQDEEGGLDDEGEVLLPRGLTFKVTKDKGPHPKYGFRQLEVEVSDPKDRAPEMRPLPEAPGTTPAAAQPRSRRTAAGSAAGQGALTGRQETKDLNAVGGDVDTSDEGVPIRDFRLRGVDPEGDPDGGYQIQSGTYFRRDGIPYLIEHPDTPEGKALGQRVQKALAAHRQSIPQSVRGRQRGYAWLDGTNPEDDTFAAEMGMPAGAFVSEANSDGLGGTYLFNRDRRGTEGVVGTLDHEFAHSLDVSETNSRRGSTSARWSAAADQDGMTRETLSDVTFSPGAGSRFPVQLTPAEKSDDVKFPLGVTSYGTANEHEDFSESYRLYQAGPIGLARLSPGSEPEPIWFRDLYPARAAILDDMMPDFADQQRREIQKVRDANPIVRIGAARKLTSARSVTSPRSRAFRAIDTDPSPRMRPLRSQRMLDRDADLDPQARADKIRATPAGVHDGVFTGQLEQGQSIADVLPPNVGREGVPVRDFGMIRIPYRVRTGRVWREDDGTVWLLEYNDDADDMQDAELRSLAREHLGLPPELRKSQRAYALLQRADPYDEWFENKYGEQFVTAASAAYGDISIFDMSADPDLRKYRIERVVQHEAAHNFDRDNGWVSLTDEWKDANGGVGDEVPIYHWEQTNDPGISTISVGRDPDASYPGGITEYARENSREDFAESVRLYLAGPVGRGSLTPEGPVIDLYLRDISPARAAILDRIMPETARHQRLQMQLTRGAAGAG